MCASPGQGRRAYVNGSEYERSNRFSVRWVMINEPALNHSINQSIIRADLFDCPLTPCLSGQCKQTIVSFLRQTNSTRLNKVVHYKIY